jgi:amidase
VTEIHDLTVTELAAAIRRRELSPAEITAHYLQRTERMNTAVGAFFTITADLATDQAAQAEKAVARPADQQALPPLTGIPIPIKDLNMMAGVRQTLGSAAFTDNVPATDDYVTASLRAAGAVLTGKTATPEFGLPCYTETAIGPPARTPWDLSRSAGGSSGGAGAALASGMVPLADGSDMGGSLRNPASFNNVVGLRPSPGRVPAWPTTNGWELTSVGGPMARSVEDVALLLSVIAGPSRRAPLSLETPGSTFAPPLHGSLSGVRVALSVDLGGAFTVDHAVADVVRRQGDVLEAEGAVVQEAHPVLHSADAAFRTMRAWLFQHRFRTLLAKRPDGFKQSLRDNILLGADLTGEDVATAYQQLTSIHDRMRAFFEDHDVLALPVSQVPPFSADEEYPSSINGEPQPTYLDWMRSAYLITVTGCPAISVPAGFTSEGWPVGIQLVGPHRGERRLLEVAHAFEQATRVGDRRPAIGAGA